jgi:predicted nucleic acid-binding protein
MKVVIDTNVLVSAILRDRTPEAVLTYVIENPTVEWCASAAIVDEYIGVLERPIPSPKPNGMNSRHYLPSREIEPQFSIQRQCRSPAPESIPRLIAKVL